MVLATYLTSPFAVSIILAVCMLNYKVTAYLWHHNNFNHVVGKEWGADIHYNPGAGACLTASRDLELFPSHILWKPHKPGRVCWVPQLMTLLGYLYPIFEWLFQISALLPIQHSYWSISWKSANNGPNPRVLVTHMGSLPGVAGSWLGPGHALPVLAIWGVNQWRKICFPCKQNENI